jgi:hypothetical protein
VNTASAERGSGAVSDDKKLSMGFCYYSYSLPGTLEPPSILLDCTVPERVDDQEFLKK